MGAPLDDDVLLVCLDLLAWGLRFCRDLFVRFCGTLSLVDDGDLHSLFLFVCTAVSKSIPLLVIAGPLC